MRALLVGAVESTLVALNALARAPGWEVAAVVTLPTELARRHSDFVDLGPAAKQAGARVIPASNSNCPEVVAQVAMLKPDLAFVIGWSQICRPPFVEAAGGRIVGYHPAPLPRLRGRAAIPWTILLAEPISAASLFWIDDDVDSGPLLGQRYFHVRPDETATGLYRRHMEELDLLLDELLPRLASGDLTARPQDEQCATWAARRTESDGEIDWSWPAARIERLIRAVTRPYPGAFTHLPGTSSERITLWEARHWPEGHRHMAAAGQVVAVGDKGLAVMCGDGEALLASDWKGPAPRLHQYLGRGR